MAYAVRYSISSLSGIYAQKYSVVLQDAARFEILFERFKVHELKGFAADSEVRHYDAFQTFNALMKVLKRLAKHANDPFCNAIIRDADGAKSGAFADEDEKGAFVFKAYAETGICSRQNEKNSPIDEPMDSIAGKQSHYHAEIRTLIDVFKQDMMNLMNICEETIAKNASIIAQTVPNSTPKPAPLVQI